MHVAAIEEHTVSEPGVLIRPQGRVLEITLDRPASGNEITAGMFDRMLAAIAAAERAGVRVMRLRANGPVFCTGRERAGHDAASIRDEVARLIDFKRAIRRSPMICIAEVQGDAAGFGMGMAILCDFTLVAAGAVLSFPEMRKGLPPAAIMAYLGQYGLPKRVFPLILLARDFTPAHAHNLGLINTVCAPGTLAAETDALIEAVLAMDPDGARQCKAYFQQALEADTETNFRLAVELLTVETLRLKAQTARQPSAAATGGPLPLT